MELIPESRIISSLVHPKASGEAAIEQLLKLTSEAASQTSAASIAGGDPLSSHIKSVWRCLVEDVVANTTPSQQAPLIDFVRELRLQTVINPTTGGPLLYNLVADYHVAVWTDLPLFGISVRDEWNFGT